jgi:hypothetical protein
MNNVNPYKIQGDIGNYKVVDTRTGYVAHCFKHHADAEACRDSMNYWVQQTSAVMAS